MKGRLLASTFLILMSISKIHNQDTRSVVGRQGSYGSYSQSLTLKDFLKQIININEFSSLVVIHNSTDSILGVIEEFHNQYLPLYNVQVSSINVFNEVHRQNQEAVIGRAASFKESKVYFAFVPNLDQLNGTMEEIRKLYFWKDRDRIIFVINHGYQNAYNEVKENFLSCFRYLIINTAFVFLNNLTTEAYTYNPFSGDYLIPVKDGDIFPDKLMNLRDFKLRISMFDNIMDAIPYEKSYIGRDGLLSQTILHHINSTFEYLMSKDGVGYGVNYKGKKFTGVFKDLISNVSDIGFNSRLLKDEEFYEQLDYTYPYDRDDLTCLVPRRKNDDVKHFESTLSLLVWMVVIFSTFIFYVYVVASIKKTRNQVDYFGIVLLILTMILGKPAQEVKIKYFRYTLVSFITFYFFINAAVSSRLTSIFTIPEKPHQIDTLKELSDLDVNILTLQRYKVMLNKTLSGTIRKKLIPKMETILESELINRLTRPKNSVLICKDHQAKYALLNKNNYANDVPLYRIMSSRPFPSLVCYVVRYGSPYLTKLDQLLSRLVESGIFDHWREAAEHNISIVNHVDSHPPETEMLIQSMSLRNMKTCFLILVIGLGMSVFVFIVEYHLYFFKLDKPKRKLK